MGVIVSKDIYRYIKTPDFLAKKQCSINPKNEKDDKCFLYCFLINKYLDKKFTNPGRITNYKNNLNELITPVGITYPINILKDVPKIELLNEMKINIFRWDNKIKLKENEEEINRLYCFYNNKATKEPKNGVLNLILLENETTKHFIYLKNLSRLFTCTHNGKKYICDNCLIQKYTSEEKLKEHKILCYKNINEEEEKIINTNIRKKISGCIQTDRIRRKIKGNITFEFIKELLIKQNYECEYCGDNLLMIYEKYCDYQFSINRIDNNFAHNINNVNITCYYCNCIEDSRYNQNRLSNDKICYCDYHNFNNCD